MGVDNNAIVFVGVRANLDASKLESFNKWATEQGFETEYRTYSEYHPGLIGIQVADSGSYGLIEIDDLDDKIETAREKFREEMNREPRTFLFNFQW